MARGCKDGKGGGGGGECGGMGREWSDETWLRDRKRDGGRRVILYQLRALILNCPFPLNNVKLASWLVWLML